MSALAEVLGAKPIALAVAVMIDLALGDPVCGAHPIRLIGRSLLWLEARLRGAGLDGYGGGILLFVFLAIIWLLVLVGTIAAVLEASSWVAWTVHVVLLYTLLALGDLIRHVWRIEASVRRGALEVAKIAAGALVGRDTDRMDAAACRRAGVESLGENLTDGLVAPVCWYVVAGLPGILLFKIVSTMDSMVGYKTPAYLRFGWCGARLDDAMNYVPARLTWLLIALLAFVMPGFSGRKAWRIGLRQHAVLPGPNAGWSEAALAGALERRLVGPIWLRGVLVTDLWVGDSIDPPLAEATDVRRAIALTFAVGLVAAALGCAVLWQP